jgi:hypothetical protein
VVVEPQPDFARLIRFLWPRSGVVIEECGISSVAHRGSLFVSTRTLTPDERGRDGCRTSRPTSASTPSAGTVKSDSATRGPDRASRRAPVLQDRRRRLRSRRPRRSRVSSAAVSFIHPRGSRSRGSLHARLDRWATIAIAFTGRDDGVGCAEGSKGLKSSRSAGHAARRSIRRRVCVA